MLSVSEPTLVQRSELVARRRQAPSAPFAHLGLSTRDQRILALTRRRLEGAPLDFQEALRALEASVEELIPAGRVYLLGATESGPIVGSLISGVGIVPAEAGPLLVRVDREGRISTLGSLSP
ncbi:hypothetical protein [Polyangium fumosum]|uniref:Uncharacterized protein n=1 Tax=Polyangium fumosum TaxID=889272 RepID=A0A4U1ISK2_9BACT|nr:hypothetical protein [Polyangium fumosum]TKC97251.1 hypothetical protein E8A74_43845 [Polyangium fumosum]